MASIERERKRATRIEVTDGHLIPVKSDREILNSWKLTFGISLLLLIALPIFFRKPYGEILFVVSKGIPITFQVTVFAILGSIVLGLFTGLGQISRNRGFKLLGGFYVEIIRGIPLLVQLIFIYYALGKVFQLEGVVAAIIALSICYGAYMGEIFRAGIQSIPKGQKVMAAV